MSGAVWGCPPVSAALWRLLKGCQRATRTLSADVRRLPAVVHELSEDCPPISEDCPSLSAGCPVAVLCSVCGCPTWRVPLPGVLYRCHSSPRPVSLSLLPAPSPLPCARAASSRACRGEGNPSPRVPDLRVVAWQAYPGLRLVRSLHLSVSELKCISVFQTN